MKGKLIIFLMAILIALPAAAQKSARGDGPSAEKKKEFFEIKLKYLADEIDLKADQKKKFVELYTQMENERRAIFQKMKASERALKHNQNATEADYEKARKDKAAFESQMEQVEKKYESQFATFLSQKQIYKLKEAEKSFMEKVRSCRDKKKANK